MSSYVNVQQRRPVETLFAVRTLEITRSGLLPQVSSQMHTKIINAGKLFRAHFTRKLFFLIWSVIATCMYQMPLQMIFASELLSASWAFDWTLRSLFFFWLLFSFLIRLARWFGFYRLFIALLIGPFWPFRSICDCDFIHLCWTVVLCVFLKISVISINEEDSFLIGATSVVSNVPRQERHKNKGLSMIGIAITSVLGCGSCLTGDFFFGETFSILVSPGLLLTPLGRPISLIYEKWSANSKT